MSGEEIKGRKPSWLKVRLSTGGDFSNVDKTLASSGLSTVCRQARCPNRTECWSAGTATFLILGDECTRGCGFCAVRRNPAPQPPAGDEPERLAEAAGRLGLAHVVITSVTRDDLADGGASVFARAIECVKALSPLPRVEVLTPDYLGEPLEKVLAAAPDVFAHNIEVVPRLSEGLRHERFSCERSLETLRQAKKLRPEITTKSSILLGVGETAAEIKGAMEDLLAVGVELLVLGQYLCPTPQNTPVSRYVTPEEFAELERLGLEMGFSYVAAGPLVRTSYHAAEAWAAHTCEGKDVV